MMYGEMETTIKGQVFRKAIIYELFGITKILRYLWDLIRWRCPLANWKISVNVLDTATDSMRNIRSTIEFSYGLYDDENGILPRWTASKKS